MTSGCLCRASSEEFFMGFGVPELLVFFFLSSTILCIVALLDILRSDFTGNNKLVWLLAVIFFPWIGSLAYFVFGRQQKVS
jgi:hypothetical protein